MYLKHFNFTSKPFAMNPDPAFLYPSHQHSTALTMLEYALESQASFCLLTGEIGSGKTTLIRGLLRLLGEKVTVGLVSNTHGGFRSIHPWALSALGIVPREASEISHYEALNEFFIGEYAKGRRTLLIFDEAQNLSVRTLEELRLLSNVNSEKDVVLQILLVGQPELRMKMARPNLMTAVGERVDQGQIAQLIHQTRNTAAQSVDALSLCDAQAYVRHRLRVAGGSEDIFHGEAIERIHRLSGGIPRLMNQLCDLSLVYAFADGCHQVGADTVTQVLKDRSDGRANALLKHELAIAPVVKDAIAGPVTTPFANDSLMPERA